MNITDRQYAVLRNSINKVFLHVNLAEESRLAFIRRLENSDRTNAALDHAARFAAAIGRARAALAPFEPIEINLEGLVADSRNLFSELALSHAMAGQAVESWAATDAAGFRLAEATGVDSELGWAARQAEEIYSFAIVRFPGG